MNAELQERLQATLQQQMSEMAAGVSDAEPNAQLESALQQLRDAITRQSELQQHITRLNATVAQHADAEREASTSLATMRSELQGVRDANARLESELQQRVAQLTGKQQQLDTLAAESAEVIERYGRLQTGYEGLQRDMRDAMERETVMTNLIEKLKLQAADANRQLEAVRDQHSNMALEISQRDASITSLKREAASLREKVGELMHAASSASSARQDAHDQIDASHEHIAHLESQIEALQEELQLREEEWRERERTLIQAASANEARAAGWSQLSHELQRYQAELALRDAEVARLQEGERNLQVALDALAISREQEISALEARIQSILSSGPEKQTTPTAPAPVTSPKEEGDPVLLHKLGAAQTKIATLQAKMHELKAALEATKAKAMDSSTPEVDRKIVGQLIFTYLQLQREHGNTYGFASARAKDSLAILCNMLGFTPDQRDAVGLNSAEPVRQSGGLVDALFSSFVKPAAPAAPGEESDAKPLSAAFVDFLMSELKEEEGATESTS